MRVFILFYSLLFNYAIISGQISNEARRAQIDAYIHSVMQTHGVPGLALAVIKDGELYYENYFGLASIEDEVLVTNESIFRVYSTTKLITATAVFNLIENGKLSLDDYITNYLADLPKEWQKVQIKHLLTHSSGLPDIVRIKSVLSDDVVFQKLFKADMDFETGDQFWYNQTNYWLLAKIIEHVTNQDFDSFVLNHQFSGNEKTAFFSSNSETIIPNRVHKYEFNSERKLYEKTSNNDGTRAHSGNGLNITLLSFIDWNDRLDRDILVEAGTRLQMWQPYTYANAKDRFRHGWGDYSTDSFQSIGFTGGGVSAFRKFTDNNLTIIYLSNGYKYFPIHNYVVDHVASIVDNELKNEASLNKELIISNFLQQPIDEAMANYRFIKENNTESSFEGILNSLGYTFMRSGRLVDAIKTFELNVSEHPTSWNVYDSLAEGYYNAKKYDAAIANYEKSLELNTDNRNASVMLEIIADERE